jgi:hypothetical protein
MARVPVESILESGLVHLQRRGVYSEFLSLGNVADRQGACKRV